MVVTNECCRFVVSLCLLFFVCLLKITPVHCGALLIPHNFLAVSRYSILQMPPLPPMKQTFDAAMLHIAHIIRISQLH